MRKNKKPHIAPKLHLVCASEAVCYGLLHPQGKRLPSHMFTPNPARVNLLSEFCMECQAAASARSTP